MIQSGYKQYVAVHPANGVRASLALLEMPFKAYPCLPAGRSSHWFVRGIYVAVVQLEERFPAKEEVIGSNPIGYTILEKSELQFAIFGLLELFLGSVFEKKKKLK